MTDIDMTRLAAEAMGVPEWAISFQEGGEMFNELYDPLHNDEQAMALVKKFRLQVNTLTGGRWLVTTDGSLSARFEASYPPYISVHQTEDSDLNHAIVECVAKMQAARKAAV